MRCAIWIMGAMIVMDVAKLVNFTLQMQTLSTVAFVISCVACFLAGLSVILFLRYICGRFGMCGITTPHLDPAGKKGMVIACAMMIFVNII